MPLDTEERTKIYKEAVLGVDPTDQRPEALEYRKKMDAEIAAGRDSPSDFGADDFMIPHEVP